MTHRATIVRVALVAVVLIAILLDIFGGTRWYSVSDLWRPSTKLVGEVIWQIRVPRALAAAMTGMLLALAGLLLQTVSHNPLADPSIIGVNAGANLAMIVGELLGISLTILNAFWLSLVGALLAFVVVIGLSMSGHGFNPLRLLLGGTIFSGFISSISYAVSFITNTTQQFRVLLVGGFSGANYQQVLLLGIVVIIVLGGAVMFQTELTLLGLDSKTSVGLGVSFKRLMIVAVVLVVLAAGSSVAVAGNIGFIGLGIPQIVNFVHPGSFKSNLAAVALCGSGFMLIADLIAKTAISSVELPLSALSAIVGGVVLFIIVAFRREAVSA